MIKIGDILSVKYLGFTHHGIYVGFNSMIHNSRKGGQVQKYVIVALGALAFFKSDNKTVKMLGAAIVATALLADSGTSPVQNALTTISLVGVGALFD